MLFDSLDKIKRNAIFSAILLIALGAVILICPLAYVPTMILACGYTLIVVGLVMMLGFFSSSKSLMDYLKFTGALILTIVGICVLLFSGNDLLKVLAWLFGFLIILDGLRTLLHSFTFARRSQRKAWWVLTIISAMMMVGGIMLFVNPWIAEIAVLKKVIGGTVLFAALASALRLFWTWPLRKEKGGSENG